MRNEQRDVSLEARVRPGAFDVKGQQWELFPFDAFEYSNGRAETTSPKIWLKTPWTFDGAYIAAGTITGDSIAAGTITADKIDVADLAADTAFLENLYVNHLEAGEGRFGGLYTEILYDNATGTTFSDTDTFEDIVDFLDTVRTQKGVTIDTMADLMGKANIRIEGTATNTSATTFPLIQFGITEDNFSLSYGDSDYGSLSYIRSRSTVLNTTSWDSITITKVWSSNIVTTTINPRLSAETCLGTPASPFHMVASRISYATTRMSDEVNITNLGFKSISQDYNYGVLFPNKYGTDGELFDLLEQRFGANMSSSYYNEENNPWSVGFRNGLTGTVYGEMDVPVGAEFPFNAAGVAIGGAGYQCVSGETYDSGTGYYTLTWTNSGSNQNVILKRAVKYSSTVWYLLGFCRDRTTWYNKYIRLVATSGGTTNTCQCIVMDC